MSFQDLINNFKNTKFIESDVRRYKSFKRKPILYVANLTKKYFGRKQPAIDKISFNIYPGEFHAFIGANGAGKTTTIKCLIGAYANWDGTILISGIKNNKEDAKKKIGYIPENARFPEKFSTFSYLKWMMQLSGFSSQDAIIHATKKLKELNLWNLRHKSPNTFSSGQKKKVLLAQALIHNPQLLVMDEPVANLDPKARIEFFNILMKLRRQGKAIFISSHVLAELDRYSNALTILDGGKIVYSGNKNDLLKHFNKNSYLVETDNLNKTKRIVKEMKITTIKKSEHNTLKLVFNDQQQIDNFQKKIIDSKIHFIKFMIVQPTLDDVYDKLVIKGSVDTAKK